MRIKQGLLLVGFGLAVSMAAAQVVITLTQQETTTLANGGTVTLNVKGTTTVTPPPPPPPPPATTWVYYDGVFNWPGDWSWNVKVDYADTTGVPLSPAADIKVSLTGPNGGWLPYAPGRVFDTTGYTSFTFAVKPKVANQSWNVYFESANDTTDGVSVNVPNVDYCSPAFAVNTWYVCTFPLSVFELSNPKILKFALHDQTGQSNTVWYVDNVGFVP